MIWQILAFGVAVAVTASPDLLGLPDGVADAFHILGPIAAAVAAMAASEVLRPLRRLHVLGGLAIAVAPFLLGPTAPAIGVGLLAGAALVALAFAGRGSTERFGGGWRTLID